MRLTTYCLCTLRPTLCFLLYKVPSFDDVAVYFSEEEWNSLNAEQKETYKHVMMENFRSLRSLGTQSPLLLVLHVSVHLILCRLDVNNSSRVSQQAWTSNSSDVSAADCNKRHNSLHFANVMFISTQCGTGSWSEICSTVFINAVHARFTHRLI